jgi:hypothetical protein
MMTISVPTNRTLAVDISHHRLVDWEKLDPQVKVVIVKATEGESMKDPRFEEHIEGALEKGLIVGAYHFYRTRIGSYIVPPIAQAEHFLDATKPYREYITIHANDFENFTWWKTGRPYNPRIGTEQLDLYNYHSRVKSEVDVFDLLYTSLGSWQHFQMRNLTNGWQGPRWMREERGRPRSERLIDDLWIANYGVTSPKIVRPFEDWWMWQYGQVYMEGVTNENGDHAPVDVNYIKMPPIDVEAFFSGQVQPIDARAIRNAAITECQEWLEKLRT